MTLASFRYLLWIVILIVALTFCISDDDKSKSSANEKDKKKTSEQIDNPALKTKKTDNNELFTKKDNKKDNTKDEKLSPVNKSSIYDLQNAIRNIAVSSTPAVVNIRSEKIVKTGNLRRFRDPFYEFFGDRDLFDRYFGMPRQQKQQALGSGFIVTDDGYIITNNHVVSGADKISVLLEDEREFKAKLIGSDNLTDLAILKIEEGKELPVVDLGNSDNIEVGDFAVAIGNPFGLKGTVTFGVISAKGRRESQIDNYAALKNYIQTDAPINQGNSGGPLLNIDGEVVGINTAIYSKTGGSIGIGFAVPINIAKKVFEQIKTKGTVERGYIGALVQDLTEDIAKHLNLKKTEGVLINSITEDGPADKSGLKSGDIILEIDGNKVKNSAEVVNKITSYSPDDKIKLKILRKGEKKDITITLGKRPAEGEERIPTSKSKDSSWLGLSFEEIKGKVVITDVRYDSPAFEGGLKPGDVIIAINYNEISSVDELNKFIDKHKDEKSFMFKVNRKGYNVFIVVTA